MENLASRFISLVRSENPQTRASTAVVCALIPPFLVAGDAVAILGGANLQPVHYLIYFLATGMNLYGLANGNWTGKQQV